jgi:vacuolar-type H+-ATPase subunit D/Vma8
MKVKLLATRAQYRSLREALDTTRRGTKFIKVEREALDKILLDHSRILAVVDYEDME